MCGKRVLTGGGLERLTRAEAGGEVDGLIVYDGRKTGGNQSNHIGI